MERTLEPGPHSRDLIDRTGALLGAEALLGEVVEQPHHRGDRQGGGEGGGEKRQALGHEPTGCRMIVVVLRRPLRPAPNRSSILAQGDKNPPPGRKN